MYSILVGKLVIGILLTDTGTFVWASGFKAEKSFLVRFSNLKAYLA